MSDSRRSFIQKFGGLLGLTLSSPFYQTLQGQDLVSTIAKYQNTGLEEVVRDETFWYQIKQAYTVSPSILNFNNGGVCPAPKVVQDALDRYNKLSNEAPSFYMWRILDQGREPLRRKLAQLASCHQDEIAINRNASEALETIIFGLALKAGDEVVLSRQDYPNMTHAWRQRELRDGIVLKWVDLQYPIEDDEQIVKAYQALFSEKTKVVHLTHVINWNGQILPVQKIGRLAHQQGIEVVVDGAHSFTHIPYRLDEMECDYFGTSLHKWLCAPIGSGMMYIKKKKIAKVFPLFGASDPLSDNIRKFENLGTRSFPIEQAIGQAIDFHYLIGGERKAERLFYLKNYWVERVMEHPKISVHTSLKKGYSGAIALINCAGKTAPEFSHALQSKYKIHTTQSNWGGIVGVRISPNVYTTTRDLDILVDSILEIADQA